MDLSASSITDLGSNLLNLSPQNISNLCTQLKLFISISPFVPTKIRRSSSYIVEKEASLYIFNFTVQMFCKK